MENANPEKRTERNAESGDAPPGASPEPEPVLKGGSDGVDGGDGIEAGADVGGALADTATLFALIGTSVGDTAQLLGLETRLVIKTVLMMVVLGVVLGLVVVGIWLSVTFIVAAGLYEYTRLGVTLSIAVASLVNVATAVALLRVLRRCARRLVFPQTRLAVRTLLDDASRTMHPKE